MTHLFPQSVDRIPVPGAHLEDFDLALVEQTIKNGLQLNRFKGSQDVRVQFFDLVGLGLCVILASFRL
jgi:hypothetical protein